MHEMMLKNYLHNKVSSLHINCISFRTKNAIKRQRTYICGAVFVADEETRIDRESWALHFSLYP